MPGKIFINYRREDSIAIAGRLHDRLAETFGRDNLFMDVDNIPVGINFEEYLKSQVAACDVILSVVGPNWLNAKDETDQRRLDKPDDFVAIEIAAALARDILVIPVLVDGTRMPKASELPASLKPFALRNAIQVRNTNFGSDAEQLIAKMREALALGRPERTEGLVILSLITSMIAAILVNICVFLTALGVFFIQSDNYAAALAASVAAFPFMMVGLRTLARDESVRRFGLVIAVGGLLAVAAFLVSSQFFPLGRLESPTNTIQRLSLGIGYNFMLFAMFFGSDWKKITSVPATSNKWTGISRLANSRWVMVVFLGNGIVTAAPSTEILYRLTGSAAATFALEGVQLLVVGFCYVEFRKALAANPARATS